MPSLALVPTVSDSHSAASRMFVPAKASAPAKTPFAPKQTPKEPITLSESTKCSFEESTRVAPLDVPPIQTVGTIVIRGRADKRTQTSEPATESRVTKQACTIEPAGTTPSPKGKKVVEHLSSTPNNDLLDVAEVTTESMPASTAKMLCERMFREILDVSDPRFLALISHLACSIKQHAVFNSRSSW